MALPLVATDVGASAEIVRPNRTGLLVPPNDAVALAAALRDLIEDEAKRRHLGLAAQALVRERFDAATNANTLVELLLSVARRPSDGATAISRVDAPRPPARPPPVNSQRPSG